ELSIAEANSRLPLANGAYIEFLAPDYYYSDTNNSSIVCKLIHGENEFLFTGDIEKKAEKNLLADGEDVSADVLKVPHHGSDTSSTEQFLEAVNGQAAIISVGSPNSYGHPKQAVLDRLTALGYVILRTDELGNIGFLSDGVGVKYKTEK
ncbi:MAG: MBL fold metallo-hydrolase, partial [Oscillospiraceae bacterium]|nr:MBL fold metallo-hydrolase [Oscillospiraceae bacterium]